MLVQVLVLDLSGLTLLRFGLRTFFWTRLSPFIAFALLFLFILCKPHFTSATKMQKVIDVTASIGLIFYSDGTIYRIEYRDIDSYRGISIAIITHPSNEVDVPHNSAIRPWFILAIIKLM